MLAQFGGRRFARDHVANQLQPARPFMGQYRAVLHRRQGLQTRLDFSRLDAETANFYLMVDASGVFKTPVGAIAGQVAGAIQTPARLPGVQVGNEAAGGQIAALEVTTGEARAADVQLTDTALGDRLQIRVEHVPRQVANRHTERAGRLRLNIVQRQRPVGHVHGGFGDAVHVDQLRRVIAKAFEPRAQARHINGFAAKDHVAQSVRQRLFHCAGDVHQLLERRGCLVEDADLFRAQQRVHVRWRTTHGMRHDHQTATVQQCPEELPHGEIKGVGMKQAPDIGVIEIKPVGCRVEQAHHIVMGQQGALGFAGRAGGVDHVREIVRVHRDVGVVLVVAGSLLDQQATYLGREQQLFAQVRLGHDQGDPAVLYHVGQAIGRIRRVQRHVSAACLEDRQQADNHLRRALHGEAHQHFRPDALSDQPVRQAVGLAIELGVAHLLVAETQGNGFSGTPGLGFDQLMQTVLARYHGRLTIPVGQGVSLFVRTQQGQFAEGAFRRLKNALQQILPVPGHALDRSGLEEVTTELEAAAQAL
ncbi:hypothetical protein PS645_05353 [Pseudomonas fluorescens]|uniref:Uncharacterized protein n=1 Tax=Pseudomonas fluorescens TaxID=294 RepID=A0A5E6XG61_PSEFL|nr:hypothetical protein PS645_05353 [Pseudomonas fluorescens]